MEAKLFYLTVPAFASAMIVVGFLTPQSMVVLLGFLFVESIWRFAILSSALARWDWRSAR